MVDVTSRLRLVVDSSGVDRSGRSLRGLTQEAKRAEDQARRMQSAFAGLAGVLGAAFSVREITRVVDEYRGIENQLRLVTSGAEDLRRAQEGVLRVANETGAALNSTAQLFGNLERFAGEFLTTQQDALDLTRAINQAAAISGAGVQEASNAVRQLSQGIAGGILRAEEFNSIVENMPRLAQALADGLGTSLGGLRKLVNEGSVTSETLIAALQTQFGALNSEFLGTSRTIGQAMQSLGNIVTVELGQRFSGAQDIAVKALQLVAENIDKIIPLAEGLAVALAAVGAGLAFPAIAAGIAALVSPLGLVAASIAVIVAFRDDIAQTFTGFDNAGAVIRVLADDFQNVLVPAIAESIAGLRAMVENSRLLYETARLFDRFTVDRGDPEEIFGEMQRLNDVRKSIESRIAGLREDIAQPGGLFDFNTRDTAVLKELEDRLERINAQMNDLTKEYVGLVKGAPVSEESGPSGYFKSVGDRARELQEQLEKSKNETAAIADEMKSVALVTGAASKEAERLAKKAEEARKAIAQDQADQEYLIERARLGERELRIAQEVLAIRRQIGDISTDEARALAERNVELDEQLENIRRQRELFEGMFDQFGKDAGNLWRAFVADGRDAAESLEDVFASLLDKFGKGLGDIFKALSSGGLNIRTGIGGIFDNIAKTFGGIQKSIEGLARGLGLGARASGVLGVLGSGVFAGATGIGIGAGLGRSVNPYARQDNQLIGGGIGAVAGGLGASAALSAFLASGTGAGAGILGGAIAGSVVPVIGTIIGGLLGAFGGSLFGKTSDEFARGVFDFNTGTTLFQSNKKNNQENIAARDSLISAASDLSTLLAQLTGGTISTLGGVSVGSRDGIQILRDASLAGDAAFRSSNVAYRGTDPEEALRVLLGQAIDGLTGGTSALVDYAKAAFDAGKSVEDIIARLEELSDFSKRLEAASDPLLAGVNNLGTAFAQVVKDANDLGVAIGPGSDVARLIQNDLAAFFDQAISGGTSVADLNARLDEFAATLEKVGVSADITKAALEDVVRAQREAFETDIADQIGQYLTGPTDQLNALLKAQKERADQAIALGADLAEVERLTNLELRNFFEGLSEDAIAEVSSFLGLFEEASDSVMRQLDLSRQDLQGLADSFGRFAQDFANLNTRFTEQFIAASPRESIGILQARATELLGQVRGGNESAAQALPQVLQQLVQNARDTFGNTKGFTEVLAFAQQTLTEAEKAALGIQSDAERQIAALDENNDILADIRDILQDANAVNALFSSVSSGGVANATDLLALIQSGAGLSVSNDNASALSVTSLIGQSVEPIITPLTDSIGQFTERLGDLPALQQLTIDAVDRGADRVASSVDSLDDRMDRIESLTRKMLEELEQSNARAAA